MGAAFRPMSPTPAPPLIVAEQVARAYVARGETVHALRGVSLTIAAGEYVSLMGPSGSGKTTFFNMIGALDVPTGGVIRIAGHDLRALSSPQLAALRCLHLGYIFQNYNLVEVLSALDNVVLPMRFLGLDRTAARDKAAALLARVGLGHRLHHLPGELSGGQQQRVAIARALANDPRLILADEPTGNLDSRTSHEIVALLASLCRERGVTVVSATHDHRMLDVSDRVVYLRGGLIERVVPRAELKIAASSISAPA
jgi:putative ABC transport system ATP-binding protein